MTNQTFKDRKEAGNLLSEKLKKYKHTNTLVLGIPRGGVSVAKEIANNLDLPLDIILSKKIGHPDNKEFAIGAISLKSEIIDSYPDVSKEYIEKETVRIRNMIKDKYLLYRGTLEPADVLNKNVIVVDDGIATGNTLLACIEMLRKQKAAKIIVAVPVLPYEALQEFKDKTDEFVYLNIPEYFMGVGQFYDHFEQVEDYEVADMLNVSTEH
ncbi:MAG: hypothetical protein RI883_599 [Bacteroidota bacterium]|jgi:predicted phosphoribosyltransferase